MFYVTLNNDKNISGVVARVQEKEVTLAEPFTIKPDPQDADVFIGYSTTPGKVSPINPKHGTDFFQILSKYLLENYQSKPLDQIYTSVTHAVTQKVHLIDDKGGMYVPQKVSTLRAVLFMTATPQIKVASYFDILISPGDGWDQIFFHP